MIESFVVHNSIVMSCCFMDETSAYADGVLQSLFEATAFVPATWSFEVGIALIVAERKKRLSEADSARFLTLLSQLPIVVEQDRTERAMNELLALARTTGLSSHDAAYLDLSMRKGLPLATLDSRLTEAAKRVSTKIYMR
jgi:predicted nucleic acid-binding protein